MSVVQHISYKIVPFRQMSNYEKYEKSETYVF